MLIAAGSNSATNGAHDNCAGCGVKHSAASSLPPLAKRKYPTYMTSILAVVIVVVSGCGGSTSPNARDDESAGSSSRPALPSVESSLTRNLSPQVTPTQLQARVDGSNSFAAEFYRSVAASEDMTNRNFVFSSHSIASTLAMAYAGAAANTAAQMSQLLRITETDEVFHASSNALALALASRSAGSSKTIMDVGGDVFIQDGFAVKPSFLDTLATNYGAPAFLMDNLTQGSAENARIAINKWIGGKTRSQVTELLPPGSTYLASLILIDTIFFKDQWLVPFDSQRGLNDVFYLADGNVSNVAFMRQDLTVRFARGPNFTVVSLPYAGKAFAMVLVLPDAGELASLEREMNPSTLFEIVEGSSESLVEVQLPKFKFKTSLVASDVLVTLGMTDAFDSEKADFSGITDAADLHISRIFHGASIAVDEKGTEAAAATAVIVRPPSAASESVILDRPFLFFITDSATRNIMFLGRVMNPSENS